jgi:hypothetical protein
VHSVHGPVTYLANPVDEDYWDEGHGAKDDAAEFITWIRTVTEYQAR